MQPLQADDPQALASYRLLGRLGVGGMGRVYLARSAGGRTVAVKVIRPDLAEDGEFRRRFRHEVEVARAVSGRYTAPVVGADTEASVPWLATAYVLGPSLTDVVSTHGAMPEPTVRALGAGLAAALTEIHAAGLIHRDLKPSNVMLAPDGPRVIDFGIARAVDGDRMTQTGVVVGSPGYLPPEQALGREVGRPGDVFSLGAVLAFAATGRSTFGELAAAAMLYQVVHGEPDLDGVPEPLAGLIAACLTKDPVQRPTPEQLLEFLAPDGVGTAFTDWLPGAVASTIATHASRILDLETPASGNPGGTASGAGFGPPPAMGTVQLGGTSTTPAATSSRRRFLGIAGGVAGAVVVGTGGAWMLAKDDSGDAPSSDDASNQDGGGEPDAFTTPADGIAPQPLWHRTAAKDSLAYDRPPMVAGELAVFNGDPVVAHDVRTGKKVWSRDGLATSGAALVLAAGKLFFRSPDHDGDLIGIAPKTGKELWRGRLGGKLSVAGVIAADDKHVYVIAEVETEDFSRNLTAIAAINHRTGKTVWQEARDEGTDDYWIEGRATGPYLVYADALENVTVRRASDGKQVWSRKIGDDIAWRPAVTADTLFVGGDVMRAVNLKTGKDRWVLEPQGRRGFNTPVIIDGILYASDHSRGVWAVGPKTGKKIWLCEDLNGGRHAPETFVRVGDHLYGASGPFNDGGIYAMERRTGKVRWLYNDNKSNMEQWNIAAAGKRLLLSHGDEVYALPAV